MLTLSITTMLTSPQCSHHHNAHITTMLTLSITSQQVYRKAVPLIAKSLKGNSAERSIALDTCHKLATFFLKHTGDLDAAYKFARATVQGNPTSARAHTTKGDVLLKMNRPLEAIEALDEAVRLKPNSTDAYSLLGEAHEKLGYTESAVKYYHKALEIDQNNNLTKFKLAYVYVQTGTIQQYVEAEKL